MCYVMYVLCVRPHYTYIQKTRWMRDCPTHKVLGIYVTHGVCDGSQSNMTHAHKGSLRESDITSQNSNVRTWSKHSLTSIKFCLYFCSSTSVNELPLSPYTHTRTHPRSAINPGHKRSHSIRCRFSKVSAPSNFLYATIWLSRIGAQLTC